MIAAAGCQNLFGLTPLPPAEGDPNAYVCGCTCFEGESYRQDRQFYTCVPEHLNPNLDGGVAPTQADLDSDCNARVRATMVGILSQCGSNQMKRRLEDDPNACVCAPVSPARFVSQCNGECVSEQLLSTCSNELTATAVGANPVVCMAEPGQATMGRVLFGARSVCPVSGTLSVVRGTSSPVSQSAVGVVEIAERQPCSGASCVDVYYRLDGQGSLDFDSYAGFASVEFRDIRISGATLSAITLDGAGNGEIAASSIASSGRGTREEEVVFGTISDTETASYVATNVEPVSVGVDRGVQAQCALVGSLLGAEIEGEPTDIALDVLGTITNQPPRADGGPDRSVECTSPAGATVALSAAASSDPDGNIVFYDWWIGGPGGAELVDAENDGIVNVAQALGSTTYALGVTDAAMSVSRDLVTVSVVDTTAPAITALSASPSSLRPRNHMMVPVTVSASATDTCGASSCRIVDVSANQPLNDLGDGDTDLDWQITGPLTVDLRAETAGLLGDRIYTIHIACGDTFGNDALGTVEVRVTQSR